MSNALDIYSLAALSRAGWAGTRDLTAAGTRLLVVGDEAVAAYWRAAVAGRGAEIVAVSTVEEARGNGSFDVIACPHALSAAPDPVETLAALRSMVTEEGMLVLSVYANYGRLPVLMLQALMRQLVPADMPREVKIAAAREFLKAVPAGHWLAHDSADFIAALNREDGSGIDALLFAPVCHHFTAAELYELLDLCGLAMVDFVGEERAHYDVRTLVSSPLLRDLVGAKPEYEQHIIADMMHAGIRVHRCYASPQEKPRVA